MRLIDADALKEFIDDCGICAICPQRAPRCSYDCDFPDIVTEKWNIAIDAQPTIDAVSVVHGEWLIEKTWYDYYIYRCNCCGWHECRSYPDVEPYNFCPNCGARMDGERKESE